METANKKEAIELFKKGFNCSQAILTTFGPKLGINKEACLKIATSFGGGMAKQQNVCGAVTGAYMVLGLKYGKYIQGDDKSKAKTYDLVNEFNKRFIEKNGSIICLDIIGENMNTEIGMKNIQENNLFKIKCEKAIANAVDILNEIL